MTCWNCKEIIFLNLRKQDELVYAGDTKNNCREWLIHSLYIFIINSLFHLLGQYHVCVLSHKTMILKTTFLAARSSPIAMLGACGSSGKKMTKREGSA